MSFHTNAKTPRLFNFHGQRCWKMILDKRMVFFFEGKKCIILGLKVGTFEKHVGKTKVVCDILCLGKKEGEWYINKKCNHLKNKVDYFQKPYHNCWTSNSRKVEWGTWKKRIVVCHYLSPFAKRPTYVGVWGFEAIVFFYECPHVA